MGIRVTNTMVTKNAMSNINSNKSSMSSLNTQMTTQKKISRPSEDPVTAIRSLRLRNSLNEISQYNDRNIPDANNWLEVTNDALTNIRDVMQTMYEKCEQAANGDNTTEDRRILLTELKNLSTQIYAEANSDYAGRTVLSGYYTDLDVVFEKADDDASYTINETLSASDVTKMTYISKKTDFDINKAQTINTSQMPQENEIYRMRLAYDGIDYDKNANPAQKFKINYSKEVDTLAVKKTPGNEVTAAGVKNTTTVNGKQITITNCEDSTKIVTVGSNEYKIDKTGRVIETTNPASGANEVKYLSNGNIQITTKDNSYSDGLEGEKNSSFSIELTPACKQIGSVVANYEKEVTPVTITDGEDKAYMGVAADGSYTEKLGDYEIRLVAETGELIMGDKIANELGALGAVNGKEPMSFTYDKTGFQRYELKPEQYFDCINKTDSQNSITHIKQSSDINYAVSFNQEIKVNVEASDAFDQATNRDIGELIDMISHSLDIEEKISKLKSAAENAATSEEKMQYDSMIEAAQRELDIANEKLESSYEKGMTNFQNYLNKINTQITDVGARQNRLDVINNRMTEQKANFKELKSSNEDKDLEEIMIEYQAALTAYQASLTATSKLSQNTLLNFL